MIHLHKYIERFDCNGHCVINPRTNQPYEYMMDDTGIRYQRCVIVTYDEAKVIQNKYHTMSVHFVSNEEKYGLKGAIFKDTSQVRKVLELIKSEEVK